jgi:hypothetical protein
MLRVLGVLLAELLSMTNRNLSVYFEARLEGARSHSLELAFLRWHSHAPNPQKHKGELA